MMNNVMVDLETLDNKPTSAIVSIGAVHFGPNGYDEGNNFYRIEYQQSCIDAGLTLSGDTIKWWMRQSDRARGVYAHEGDHLAQVLIDNAILSNAYSVMKLDQPWLLWNDRCYRTIASLHPRQRFQQGVHHNAFDD